jgi:hypothetical protein
MRTWWGLIRTDGGGYIRITVQAENSFVAYEMMKAMYGDKLLTRGANLVN